MEDDSLARKDYDRSPDVVREENLILRRMLWSSHGHTGMYGDDGEMQCSECMREFGFFDWKRTPVQEINDLIVTALAVNIRDPRRIDKILDAICPDCDASLLLSYSDGVSYRACSECHFSVKVEVKKP